MRRLAACLLLSGCVTAESPGTITQAERIAACRAAVEVWLWDPRLADLTVVQGPYALEAVAVETDPAVGYETTTRYRCTRLPDGSWRAQAIEG